MTLPKAGPISRLIVICGPSGVGKGTLIACLLREVQGLVVSISATTRPRRAGKEVEGRDYYFLSDEEFHRRVCDDDFLEHATFSKHHYGTPRSKVLQELQAGRDVILEIELQGARQVAEQFPSALMIFVKAPSLEELERRLRARGTEADEEIRRRMVKAREELELVEEGNWAGSRQFDYVIVNDSISDAANELVHIVKRTREQDEQADSR